MGPGKIALTELILTVRERADRVNDDNVTDPEITRYLNLGLGELHDLLAQSGDHYAEASATLTTDGTGSVALPSDFLRADGTDVQYSSTPSGRKYPLRRLNWQNRNLYPNNWQGGLCGYVIRGDRMYLLPTPPAGLTLTLWYVPMATPLALSSVINCAAFLTGSSITVNGTTFATFANDDDLAEVIRIAAASSSSALYGLSASAAANVVTLTCDRPMTVELTAISPTMWAPLEKWSSFMQTYDRWDELPILSAVIACKQKDEQDVSVDLAQKAALLERLKRAKLARDQSAIVPIGDVMGQDMSGYGVWPWRW